MGRHHQRRNDLSLHPLRQSCFFIHSFLHPTQCNPSSITTSSRTLNLQQHKTYPPRGNSASGIKLESVGFLSSKPVAGSRCGSRCGSIPSRPIYKGDPFTSLGRPFFRGINVISRTEISSSLVSQIFHIEDASQPRPEQEVADAVSRFNYWMKIPPLPAAFWRLPEPACRSPPLPASGRKHVYPSRPNRLNPTGR